MRCMRAWKGIGSVQAVNAAVKFNSLEQGVNLEKETRERCGRKTLVEVRKERVATSVTDVYLMLKDGCEKVRGR